VLQFKQYGTFCLMRKILFHQNKKKDEEEGCL